MKKSIICLVFAFTTLVAFAQEDKPSEYRTIFGNKETTIRGLATLNMEFSSLNNTYAIQTGGSMGMLLNKQVIIGGYIKNAMIDRIVTINNENYDNVNMTNGGLWLGYIFLPNLPIHPVVSLQSGWGKIKYNDNMNTLKDNVLVLNPKLECDINITNFFRIAIGAHYTFTSGDDLYAHQSNADYSGPGGSIALRFGWFK